MDCFYAQCETVRLGLPQSLPLCLIQWNSVLAVNYPARDKFDIRRMDSVQVVREKSLKQRVDDANCDNGDKEQNSVDGAEEGCICIHLPVMSVNDAQNQNNNNNKGDDSTSNTTTENDNNEDYDDLNNTISAYNTEFNQPQHNQHKMYLAERNVMRSPSEGKANLNRYRLASARIFGLIDDTLGELLAITSNDGVEDDNNGGGGEKKSSGYVLERASIDELFIDVTEFCYGVLDRAKRKKGDGACREKSNNNDENNGDDGKISKQSTSQKRRDEFQTNCLVESAASLKESVICHQNHIPPSHIQRLDIVDDDAMALQLGCHIAHTVRRKVFDTLGFTLSAGISTSKLVAKLAASYGKPNGQAIIYPEAISYVMEETEIRKARMLGGKLGKKVQSLLPPEIIADDKKKATLGCVARLLTLDDLVSGLGEENGRWVFDACRGIEHEEVKSTLKVLPKSITAFKSFPKVSYPELEKWTALLARDVMKRVQLDNARNYRIPRSVTVGYTMKPGGSWIGKTFRLPFPTDRDFDARVQRLVDNTRKILTERGEKSFIRIGFSAIDFVERPKVGIDSFFAQREKKISPTKMSEDVGTNKAAATESTRDRLNARLRQDQQQQKEASGLHGWLAKVDNTPVSSKAVADNATSSHCGADLKQSIQKENEIKCKSVDDANNTASVAEEIDQEISSDEELARRLQSAYDEEVRGNSGDINQNVVGEDCNANSIDADRSIALQLQHTTNAANDDVDERDRAIARELQSKYDREHSILSDVERFSGISKRRNGTSPKNQRGSSFKKKRIDSFFSKR